MESEVAGEVGDFRVAGLISPVAPEELLCELVDWVFRCLLCRRVSSLWSFMRIDRLAGAISSDGCNDFDRIWRLEAVGISPSLIDLSRSDSESDESPDDEELE